MENQNSDQSWALKIVGLFFYVALGVAIGYVIAHYWPAYYDLHRH